MLAPGPGCELVAGVAEPLPCGLGPPRSPVALGELVDRVAEGVDDLPVALEEAGSPWFADGTAAAAPLPASPAGPAGKCEDPEIVGSAKTRTISPTDTIPILTTMAVVSRLVSRIAASWRS